MSVMKKLIFWDCVAKTELCWIWTASKNSDGYGGLKLDGKSKKAHRVSWEMHNGPIPPGMHVLHRCDNPPCVRPDHLFLGTHKKNMEDRELKKRHGFAFYNQTHCRKGHELTPDNIGLKRRKYCIKCKRISDAKYRQANGS